MQPPHGKKAHPAPIRPHIFCAVCVLAGPIILKCPFTVYKDGDFLAVFGGTGDVGVGGTDHHVLVDGGVVQALFHQLGTGHGASALDVGGVACAKGNVAGGVLVKQRVEEQHAAAVDGAGGGFCLV